MDMYFILCKSNTWIWHHTIVYIICTLIIYVNAAEEIQVHLQMREETPPFTRIGSVTSSLPAEMGSKLHFLTDSTFFSITPTTGEVRVARLIDRERLCPEFKICCGVLACQLDARIFVTDRLTGEFAASVNLKVDVQDQNDNRPTFVSASQKVSISEAAVIGTHMALTPAMDADIEPANQIQRYTLVEPTGTFLLDLSELPALRLQLIKPLDRERTSSYTATLEACDPGACARQSLEINVLDENDNKPRFTTLSFTKRLMENIKVGEVVLHLNATDADSGDRGRVVYSLHGIIDPDLLETFELVQDTGEIKLKHSLAANIRDNYRFKVIACDAVSPSCSGDENSTVEVTLLVEDVNNFAPVIHTVAAGVALLATDSGTEDSSHSANNRRESGQSDGLSILENTPPSQVAVLTVRDADVGENARVNCYLNDTKNDLPDGSASNNFILSPSAPGIYSLRTARMFDHELEPAVSTKVVCHDYGTPQRLTSARVIVVKVGDVNEFQPEFSRRVYVGRVAENAPAGMEILLTTATDRDRGAVLQYSFAPSSMQQVVWERMRTETMDTMENLDIHKYFVIDTDTGVIRTSQIPLDRETVASVTLVVMVTDSKLPPTFTATTTVSVEILDENDNAPVFINPPAEPVMSASSTGDRSPTKSFTVMENAPRFTRLSEQLEARDPDQGDNSRVHFSLLDTYAVTRTSRLGRVPAYLSHVSSGTLSTENESGLDTFDETGLSKKVVDHPVFRITPDGGIETLVELDRETVPTYILKIAVQDRGAQPLTSTVMLRVDVKDANDNAPVWVFPTPADRTINLTTAMKPGSLAGRLRAEDADIADAGRVDYMFLGPRGESLRGVSIHEGLLNSLSTDKMNDETTKSMVEITTLPPTSESHRGYRMGPFYLNGTTGEIWIAQLLTSGAINLHLRAKDRGTPSSQTDAWLTINVFVDPSEDPSFFSFGGDGTLNITIILVMITITAIVSLFLIIGIVCVRRRPMRYTPQGTINVDGTVSPSCATSPYSVDTSKDGIATAVAPASWSSSVGLYPAGQYYSAHCPMNGTILDDGQIFTTLGSPGLMGYGALVTPSDGASLVYVPHTPALQPANAVGSINGSSITAVPVDRMIGPNQMHTFGTMGRTRGSLSGGLYAASSNCGTSYEPHLDADSGDSGRGPSEEGNQFLLAEGYRNGMNTPGSIPSYSYHTYAGYRPSSRTGYRTAPYMEDAATKLHSLNCPSVNGMAGACACHALPDHQSIYAARYYPQQYDMTDYNPIIYPPSYNDLRTGIIVTSDLPIIAPPRSPIMTESNPKYVRTQQPDVHIGATATVVQEMTENQPTSSTVQGQYLDSMINHGASPRADKNGAVVDWVGVPNGTITPLRIDLRKSGATEEVDRDQSDAYRLHCVAQVPVLPPLASKKISVTAQPGDTAKIG